MPPSTQPPAEGSELMRAFMADTGLSAKDISRRLLPHPDRCTVIRWANGTRRPSSKYQVQIHDLSGGRIPRPSWLSEAERAREDWIAEHPEAPGGFPGFDPDKKPRRRRRRTRRAAAVATPAPTPTTPGAAEAATATSEVVATAPQEPPQKALQRPRRAQSERTYRQPPAPPPAAVEDPSVPPGLSRMQHYRCSPSDPLERIRDRYTKKYEVMDENGGSLGEYADVAEAKQALDQNPHAGAGTVQCMKCKCPLAYRQLPSPAATEQLARQVLRQPLDAMVKQDDLR